MKKVIISAISAFVCFNVPAQKSNPKKIQFTSVNQFGLLAGSTGESSLLQTINGVSSKGWFGGIGTGVDFYGQRSVPLFVDIRKELFKSAGNRPFVYADAGVHFQWLNFIQRENRGFPDARPGLYYDAGLGYNILLGKKTALVLSAGYAYKRVSEDFTSYHTSAGGQWQQTKDKRVSEYRRLAVKVGITL